MAEIVFKGANDQALTNSLLVAEKFGKEHDNVLKAIRNILKEGVVKNNETPLFEEISYTNEQNGQNYPMFVMNRDGFTLLAMGFTGKKAMKFKLDYISAFNKMEKIIKEHFIPQSFAEALRLAADQQEKIEQQQKLLEQQAPKAKYFDDLVERKLNLNFRDTAKEIGIKERDFIGNLLEKGYIYRDKKGKIKPCAEFTGSLFVIKECTSGDKWAGNQTLITPKGRETFNLLFGNR